MDAYYDENVIILGLFWQSLIDHEELDVYIHSQSPCSRPSTRCSRPDPPALGLVCPAPGLVRAAPGPILLL
jgi:hypothetical protein